MQMKHSPHVVILVRALYSWIRIMERNSKYLDSQYYQVNSESGMSEKMAPRPEIKSWLFHLLTL